MRNVVLPPSHLNSDLRQPPNLHSAQYLWSLCPLFSGYTPLLCFNSKCVFQVPDFSCAPLRALSPLIDQQLNKKLWWTLHLLSTISEHFLKRILMCQTDDSLVTICVEAYRLDMNYINAPLQGRPQTSEFLTDNSLPLVRTLQRSSTLGPLNTV